MDWKIVGTLVASVAPMAGKILGSLIPFPGGSLIGEQFGKIIARQFGVDPTPEAVAGAVNGNPNEVVLAKINQAIEVARIEVNGFTDVEKAYLHAIEVGLAQTNETMRAQIGHEHWFFTGWRPAIGWVFVLFALSFGVMLSVAAAAAAFMDNARPLQILTDAWPIFLAYFGTLGLMVGVYIPSRSAEKKSAIDNAAPMPNAKPVAPAPIVKPAAPVNAKPGPKTIPLPPGDRT